MAYTDADRQEHLREILEYLYHIAIRDLRIPIVTPSSSFTPEAALAVRAYQQAYTLPVTGEIDAATWDSITATYRLLTDAALPLTIFPHHGFRLQRGDTGELVYLVQVLLNTMAKRYANLPAVPVSGSYDIATSDAVMRLQKLAALPENGILDRTTWDHLAAFINQLRLTL